MSIVTTTSRVTRNSINAELLRKQCEHATQRGGYFEVTEIFEDNGWYSVFVIAVPVDDSAAAAKEF